MPDSLRSILWDGAARFGVVVSDEQATSVEKYVKLLYKWNKRISLTSAPDEREIVSRHVIDSLAVIPHVPVRANRAVDVGSGAGLPGAILAIVRPAVTVVALEPIRKKHAFLSALRRELPLQNFEPRAERLDAHLARSNFDPYDVAVSRATWRLDEWLERARPAVGKGGVVIGMEGAEQHDLPRTADRFPYELGDRTRAIVVLGID